MRAPYTSNNPDGTSRFLTTAITKRWSHSGAEIDAEKSKKQRDGSKNEKVFPPGFFQNKQELLSLVDQTQTTSVDEHISFTRDPYMRGYADADGPRVTVSERGDDRDYPSFSEVRAGDDDVQLTVAKLWRAVQRRLGNPFKTDIEHVYQLYRSLPDPRMPYLHAKIRHSFMKVLGREERDHASMLRYFAVIADIKRSGLRLTRHEWNFAISFAARYVGHSTEVEAAAALRLWKEMEADTGVKGNEVTFNILFDVASKASNFTLAEMLYQEMERRGLPYNRYHHVSLIHFFGLKQDSDGIRAAYKETVEAGEMIDTTVLNCVIAGFLRCGEEYAAERVYERMKAAHERATDMPFRNYVSGKVITKVLMMFAKISRQAARDRAAQAKAQAGTEAEGEAEGESEDWGEDPEEDGAEGVGAGASQGEHKVDSGDDGALRRHFQKHSPIVPDIQTYRILLNHYAVRMSALDKVAHFLDDMKWFQVPLHGAVFLALFKGFANHGGRGQQWSPQRLDNVWRAFSSALAANTNDLYVDVWMAKWVLLAFRKCHPQDEDRVWEVWQELRPRCEEDFVERDVKHFEKFLMDLFQGSRNRTVGERGMFGKTIRRW